MFSSRVVKAAIAGLIQQIPGLGPVFQSVLAEVGQARFESQVMSLLHEIARQGGKPQRVDEIERPQPELVDAVLQTDARQAGRLVASRPSTSVGRFLYLAGEKFASEARTYEIAIDYQFLWRPYHRKGGSSENNVQEIRAGDLIVLDYRSRPGRFRVSLPLIIKESGPNTRQVLPSDGCQAHNHDHAPFDLANEELAELLVAEGYKPDSIFNAQCGLNVDPLEVAIEDSVAKKARRMEFPSPGMATIWRLDLLEGNEAYRELCDWADSL